MFIYLIKYAFAFENKVCFKNFFVQENKVCQSVSTKNKGRDLAETRDTLSLAK